MSLQVFAGLLEASAISCKVERYAEPDYSFTRHAADAFDKRKRLYTLLGPGGADKYDYVVFQVGCTLSEQFSVRLEGNREYASAFHVCRMKAVSPASVAALLKRLRSTCLF